MLYLEWVNAFAEYYLGEQHRCDLEGDCAMAALTPEVVRLGGKMQTTLEEKMTLIADRVALGLDGRSDNDRRARAWSMLGILIGGINIARAMSRGAASDEIAAAIKVSAIKAAGETRKLPSEENGSNPEKHRT